MATITSCPKCSKQVQVPDELLGKRVQCPECKNVFVAEPATSAVSTVPKKSSPGVPSSSPPPVPTKTPEWEKPRARLDDDEEDDDRPRKKKRSRRREDDDDDDDDRPSRRRRRSDLAPHRGGMILAFGLIALIGGFIAGGVLFIFGPIAWIMGNNDLREIREGRMDREGEGMTQAGRICGIIATILAIVGILLVCLYFVFIMVVFGALFAGAAGAAKNQPFPPPRKF